MRPVIGIAAVCERARWAFWDQTAHLVADSYVAALQAAGAIAVLLPIDAGAVEPLLDRVDGLMLIGGADLDPASYGRPRERSTEKTYPERDEFELALTRAALARGLPFFGICRGMQILNVALGGTLDQELAGEDGTTPHRRALGSFVGTEHEAALTPGSLAARAAGEERHLVRCHHHQAILELGAGLAVSGRALVDAVPEAIERSDGSWALGVQWHPEADEHSPLFDAFVAAAANPVLQDAKGAVGEQQR